MMSLRLNHQNAFEQEVKSASYCNGPFILSNDFIMLQGKQEIYACNQIYI